jgi:hypothetical protein
MRVSALVFVILCVFKFICGTSGTVRLQESIVAGNGHNGLSMVPEVEHTTNRIVNPMLEITNSCFIENGGYGVEVSTNIPVKCSGENRATRNMIGVVSAVPLPSFLCYDNAMQDTLIRSATDSIQDLANKALAEGTCCVLYTGPHYVKMDKYDCLTCG